MKKNLLLKKLVIVVLLVGLSSAGWAQVPFTKGNLAIYRVGDGTGTLANTGNPVFIDEYTPSGILVQSIALPTTINGTNYQLVSAGNGSSEGAIALSADGKYIVLAGYGANIPYTSSLPSTLSTVVPRVIGVVNSNGIINTTTALTDAATGSNPRSVCSTNGTDLWICGGAGGARYTTLNSTTSTQISATPTNLRVLNIFNNQLYTTSGSGAFRLASIGTGIPTTTGQTTTNLPGFPTTGSPYGFFFADLSPAVAGEDVVYVADDGGTIQKYSLVGGIWIANGTIAATGIRGLTGSVSGSNVTLYGTSSTTSSPYVSSLLTLSDASGYNTTISGTVSTIVTFTSSTKVFRGIAFTPSINTALTITSPVSGEQWAQGSTHNITWTATGTNTNVKIEYTGNASDATPTWVTINESETTPASAGTYSAQVPVDLAVSADSKIRISDIPETVSAMSDIFSIIAAPTPVASFVPANTATGVGIASDITVSFNVPVRNIDDSEITDVNLASLITLKTTDAAGTAVPFTATIDAAKKVITINPDADLANEQLYYVAIAPVEGLSNNATTEQTITFTTAASLAPSLTDVTIAEASPYYAGDEITIKWVSKNITDVKVEAYIPSENKWEVIIPTTPSTGSVVFPIPVDAQYSTDYKLRVSDVVTPSVSAESSTFTIIGALTNVAITEAAPYYAGDEVTVTWTAKNISTVKIQLLDPATSTWSSLATGVPAADGSKKVILPASLQSDIAYKIKVTNEDNNTGLESAAFEAIAVVKDLITLRAVPAGVKVKFAGVATVTYARTSRNQKYIQDATAAILIDDPNPGIITGTYQIGDGITNIVGKNFLYNDLIEFVPISGGEPATGITIVPEVRTLESLKPADQCKLVKIENFAFKTPTQHDASGKFPTIAKNFDIEGFDNTLMQFRTGFTEANYMGGFVPVGPISTIALVGQFKTTMQITSRSWADMTVPTVADFMADKTFVLTGENVSFMDMSSNHPTSWEWTFEGGTPATSTEQNPVVTYAAKGTYAVTLKATNPSGVSNTVTKTDYISIGVVGIPTTAAVVTVYPNPTSGKLFITNPTKGLQTVEIFNTVGKQVNSVASAKEVISFDISGQEKGMYLVKMTNNETKTVQYKKIVLR